MADVVKARVFVSGRVQGVFFRSSTREQAVSRTLTGWVKNLDDGRVEAVFEGSEPAVKDMIAWCNQGSSSSSVDEVKVEWERPKSEYNNFSIKY